MKIRIDVTQEDIELGCRHDPWGDVGGGCMVHRAFMRATEGAFPYIGVSGGTICIYPDDPRDSMPEGWVELPPVVRPKIEAFDEGFPVEPFSFEIDLPIEAST